MNYDPNTIRAMAASVALVAAASVPLAMILHLGSRRRAPRHHHIADPGAAPRPQPPMRERYWVPEFPKPSNGRWFVHDRLGVGSAAAAGSSGSGYSTRSTALRACRRLNAGEAIRGLA